MNKFYTILILGLFCSSDVFSQNSDLGKMSKTNREKYLTNLGIEVTRTYGPGYYRENSKPIISGVKKFENSDPRPEISKNVGREYYEVIFPYDPSKESLEWNFLVKICVWKDNGQPFSVFFGNGVGINFIFDPYKKSTKSNGVEQIPYEQADKPVNIFEKPDSTKTKSK